MKLADINRYYKVDRVCVVSQAQPEGTEGKNRINRFRPHLSRICCYLIGMTN